MKKNLLFTFVVFTALAVFYGCSTKTDTHQSAETLVAKPKEVKKDSPSNQKLKDASSPYEDLVEFALAKDVTSMDKSIKEIESGWMGIKDLIPAEKQMKLENLLAEIKDWQKKENYHAIALSSVESYKYIVSSLDESQLVVPVAVSMLDYVGFKLQVLTNLDPVNWEAIQASVKEGVGEWQKISQDVSSNKALYNAMVVSVEGLQESSSKMNLDMTRFAAKVDLEMVDLLEHSFEDKNLPQ